MSRLSRWYGPDADDPSGKPSSVRGPVPYLTPSSTTIDYGFSRLPDPAASAFEQGLRIFKDKFTNDPKKRARLDSLRVARVEDVVDAVKQAQKRYDSQHDASSTTKRAPSAFSKKVCYYGQIMDVLVQHHPEYVALVWGAMKFFFVVIVENERLLSTIVTGLCDVADALHRVELAGILYRTDRMQTAIAELYAHIIKFLIRSLDWYEKSRIARVIDSIAKPAALRYQDIIQNIEKATERVSEEAAASSRAEQRDMHTEIQAVSKALQNGMRADQLLHKATHEQLQALFDLLKQMQGTKPSSSTPSPPPTIQITRVEVHASLTLIQSCCQIYHQTSLEDSISQRNKRRHRPRLKCKPFWVSPQMYHWNTSVESSLFSIKATFRDRQNIRDFCTSAIEQLVAANTTTFWILHSSQGPYSLLEALRSLVYQALHLDPSLVTDSLLSHSIRRFQDVVTIEDLVELLCQTLSRIRVSYIFIDIQALEPSGYVECQQIMGRLPHRLEEMKASVIVRILLMTSGPQTQQKEQRSDVPTLRVPRISQRKGKRLPKQPLRLRQT